MPRSLRRRQIEAEGIPLHFLEGGWQHARAIVFVHGWPQCSAAFEEIMVLLDGDAHVVALDLPGIGESKVPASSNDKRTLASIVHAFVAQLGLRDVTLVGHDVGGQIAYAYLRAFPDELARAALMNIAIPGVEPWSEIKKNPGIWHFAFHAIPHLPETLVGGREAAYFDYFYDTIAATPGAVGSRARKTYAHAYARAEALHAGFEWYRAFAQDERHNLEAAGEPVRTPVLYLRGEKDPGLGLDAYVEGLRRSGVIDVRGEVIPDSGHFAPDEQPEAVAAAVRKFAGLPS